VVFEAFHYMKPAQGRDLTCSLSKRSAISLTFWHIIPTFVSTIRKQAHRAMTVSGGPAGGASPGIGANGET